jgi:hypothetical protein
MSGARVLEVSAEAYLKLPGLSPSIAHVLLSRCAEVARFQYEQKLEPAEVAGEPDQPDDAAAGGDDDDDPKASNEKQKRLDRGAVLHSILLGTDGERLQMIPRNVLGKGDKYTTVRSKELRDTARARGKVPVKEPDMERFERIIENIRGRLALAGHVLDGVSELAIEWYERTTVGEVQCRTRIDHVRLIDGDGHSLLARPDARPVCAQMFEVKFPDDASPDRTERTAEQMGHGIAAAARRRALNALYPSLADRITYRWLHLEPQRPYAMWTPTPTGCFMELGDRRWCTAVHLWAQATKSGRWLGYHEDIMRCQVDLPRWVKVAEGFMPDE